MAIFVSPTGNREVWETKPEGYLTDEEWAIANPPPVPLLEDVRAVKIQEIGTAFLYAEETGHLTSSLGFEIDATPRANRDTEGLIAFMSASNTATTYFCDYDNVMHEVTLNDIQTMRLEIIAHGQTLYAKKWALRSAAESAASLAELDAIRWEDGA